MVELLNSALGDPEKLTLISVLFFMLLVALSVAAYLFRNCCQKLIERALHSKGDIVDNGKD